MLRRTSAALVAGTTAVVLTGCGLAAPITTQKPYNPSDGVRVVLNDDVRAENLLLLTEGQGENALLIGVLVNDSRTDATTFTIADDNGELYSTEIDAHTTDNINDEPVLVTGLDAAPGSVVPLTVTAGGNSVTYDVPLLDGTLEEYSTYLEEHADALQGNDTTTGTSQGDAAE